MSYRVRKGKLVNDSEESASYRYFQHLGRIEDLRRVQRAWFWDDLPKHIRAGVEREMDAQAVKATRIKIEEID